MILAGDEFGQTQGGNNNPYCQDNETTWLNWNLLNTNLEILEYVKSLINLRKAHPILHMEEELRNMEKIKTYCYKNRFYFVFFIKFWHLS